MTRCIPPDTPCELDRPDTNPDGTLYAWGDTIHTGEPVLWTFDPRQPPGKQVQLVVFEMTTT